MAHFFDMSRKPPVGELPEITPATGRRARNLQRLQIGLAGVGFMALLVGLASIIQNQAAETDATAVPQAASTTEPSTAPQQNDPLAEAGVMPDMPSDPLTTVRPGETGNAPPQGRAAVVPD